jgi:hypothetical protein
MSAKRIVILALLLISLVTAQDSQEGIQRSNRARRRPAPFRKSKRHYMDVGQAISEDEVSKL